MKALGLIYGKYVSDNGGHRPSNEDSLRKFATDGGGGGLLKQFGIKDPAKLFVSPRDGRPLTISYGTGVVTEGNPVAGYERESTDGKRWVAWTTGSVMLVSDDEFQKIRFAP
ncbi:MAG: hypothetical protein AB7G28_08970 [Pirellulales bacterium]